jgi:hypothetical protein
VGRPTVSAYEFYGEDWALMGDGLLPTATCLCGAWPLDEYGTWCPSCERTMWLHANEEVSQ